MREIKFRAWDFLDKKMLYLNEEMSSVPYYELFCNTPDKRALELMQYTDLKDKNGKEVYEGDIVNCFDEYNGSYIAPVIFARTKYTIDAYKAKQIENPKRWDIKTHDCIKSRGFLIHWGELSGKGYYCLADVVDIEVIGNIYENPELVKEAL